MSFKLNKASEQASLTYRSGYFVPFNLLAGEARYLKGSHRREVTKEKKDCQGIYHLVLQRAMAELCSQLFYNTVMVSLPDTQHCSVPQLCEQSHSSLLVTAKSGFHLALCGRT